MMNNYFAVKCKCGHVGRNYYILITFPVIAENKKEAARIARSIPRCKHHHKDCIREVVEITYEEFIELEHKNNADPYLKCRCVQEQRNIDLSDRVVAETEVLSCEHNKESIHNIYFGKTRVKYPKKYFRFNSQQTITYKI